MINNTYIDYDSWEFMSDDERMEFLKEESIDDWYNVDEYGYSGGLFDNRSSWDCEPIDEEAFRASVEWNETHDEWVCDTIDLFISKHIIYDYYEDYDRCSEILNQVYDDLETLFASKAKEIWSADESDIEKEVIRVLADAGMLRLHEKI